MGLPLAQTQEPVKSVSDTTLERDWTATAPGLDVIRLRRWDKTTPARKPAEVSRLLQDLLEELEG